MARLSGRGKKRREGKSEKEETGGQLGKRNLGLVRATGLSSGSGRREWSIRGLLRKTLHLELASGSDLRAGTAGEREKEGKILLRHFARWFRAISDAPPHTKPWSIDRHGLSRCLCALAPTSRDSSRQTSKTRGNCSWWTRWMDGWGPSTLKAIAVVQVRLLALPGSSWSCGI